MKKARWIMKWPGLALIALMAVGAVAPGVLAGEIAVETAAAAEEAATVTAEMFTVNNLWVLMAGCLVFIMHLGFACLESGLTRAKNTVNILFKNSMIICIGLLTYAICGFVMMYPDGNWILNGLLGWGGMGVTVAEADAAAKLTAAYGDGGYTWYTDFFFQAMFAATAATIVSGAVAERIKLHSFLVFTTVFVAICYPITGSWKWGEGWLDNLGFYDFAGSTIVHSVGGWGALVGAIILGARIGKYTKSGKMTPIPGHSMPLATIGVFLLWLGWFGFNGGSVLSADPANISLVCTTTALAAAAGGVAAMVTAWAIMKKPDLSITLNGILAGLVGITAGADLMSIREAVIIGAIAGAIVVLAVMFFDKVRIDDPVGAISVHLVCGIWGTLAVGIFGSMAGLTQLWYQFVGVASIGVFTAACAAVLFLIIKATMGLRVSSEEEIEGLDIGEHGNQAYPDFVVTQPAGIHGIGHGAAASVAVTAGATVPKPLQSTT
jgi:Amt family ammonium transporter